MNFLFDDAFEDQSRWRSCFIWAMGEWSVMCYYISSIKLANWYNCFRPVIILYSIDDTFDSMPVSALPIQFPSESRHVVVASRPPVSQILQVDNCVFQNAWPHLAELRMRNREYWNWKMGIQNVLHGSRQYIYSWSCQHCDRQGDRFSVARYYSP